MSKLWPLSVLALLVACHSGPETKQLQTSAQTFINQGGLTLYRIGGRPCLRAVDLHHSVTRGFHANTLPWVVDLIERQKLAKVTRQENDDGSDLVTLTPLAPYLANWTGPDRRKHFCFGTLKLLKVEPVSDAKTIIAGITEPYLIPGTEALSTRVTYRLDDVPGGTFVNDLQNNPLALTDGALRPDAYGKERTVVLVLPLNPKHFAFQ